MAVYNSKYTFELWSKTGLLLADLGGTLISSRRITKSRNNPEIIEFELDLNDFERYCQTINVDPKLILITASTEVRVKRLGTYIAGGQLIYKTTRVNETGKTIYCRAHGFLALFAKRFTGMSTAGTVLEVHTAANGTAKSRTDLAWYLISASQALTNGDFGVTRGLTGGSTTPRDKTYTRSQIMSSLQNLTQLDTDPIDIEITYDKVFNTYASIGSTRPEIVFEYPGNILSFEVPDDATDLTNEVIGLGSGAADGTQARYDAIDTPSQLDYQLRQDIFNSSATDNSNGGLTDGAEAVKDAKSRPLVLPRITVNGNVAPYVTDYNIGDRFMIKINDHTSLSDIHGMYRLEKIHLNIDNDDNEKITLEVTA